LSIPQGVLAKPDDPPRVTPSYRHEAKLSRWKSNRKLLGYATGSVTVKLDQAGLVGDNDKFIDTSYSTGAPKANPSYQGGFIELDLTEGLNGTLTFDYWDLTTSGITDPSQDAGSPKNDPGITGLTGAKYKSGLPAGFDKSVWAQNAKINNGYPYLIDNLP
jgi:hypothetical protein